MRKRLQGKTLSRSTSHRRALLSNLAAQLFMYGQIETTLPKAKYLRPFAERLISKAKTNSPHIRALLQSRLYTKEAVDKLLTEIGPRYNSELRLSGFTRIIKLSPRKGDSAEAAIIQLVQAAPAQLENSKSAPASASEASIRNTKQKPNAKDN